MPLSFSKAPGDPAVALWALACWERAQCPTKAMEIESEDFADIWRKNACALRRLTWQS